MKSFAFGFSILLSASAFAQYQIVSQSSDCKLPAATSDRVQQDLKSILATSQYATLGLAKKSKIERLYIQRSNPFIPGYSESEKSILRAAGNCVVLPAGVRAETAKEYLEIEALSGKRTTNLQHHILRLLPNLTVQEIIYFTESIGVLEGFMGNTTSEQKSTQKNILRQALGNPALDLSIAEVNLLAKSYEYTQLSGLQRNVNYNNALVMFAKGNGRNLDNSEFDQLMKLVRNGSDGLQLGPEGLTYPVMSATPTREKIKEYSGR